MIVKSKLYLTQRIRRMQSFLCIGLDPDLKKIPSDYLSYEDPLFRFCSDVVSQTQEFAVAYKINIAFFENHGAKGWDQLERLIRIIPQEIFVIADAKRADIGNTSEQYANYYFDKLEVDALTLHPYMGYDSLEPFINYKNHWSVILALTSNPGSSDFEKLRQDDGDFLFEKVLSRFGKSDDNIMFVVGATQPDYMRRIRDRVPDHFLLIPGVGEQGGDLTMTIQLLRNDKEGVLINVSRGILYPNGKDSTMKDIFEASKTYAEKMKHFFK